MHEIIPYKYPAPFCLIKNFFNQEKLQKVKDELNQITPYLRDSSMTGAAAKDNVLSVKRKGLFIKEANFLRGNTGIHSIFDKIIDPFFVQELCSKSWVFQYLQNSHIASTLISLYEEGDEYKPHQDKSVLSIIYYIFDGEFEGGDFYMDNVKIPIENNSLIIFPSCVRHAVSPLTGKGKRWSITTFFNLKSDLPNDPINIFKFTDFTSPDEWSMIKQTINNGNWTLSERSTPDPQSCKLWNIDLSNNELFTKTLFERIPHGPWKLQRVYANGQLHGQNGDFHQDNKKNNFWTFLLYATDIPMDYIQIWGGTTEFQTENGVVSVFPQPNSAVLFKSDILHKGNGPSRYTNDIRVTIAWKLEKA